MGEKTTDSIRSVANALLILQSVSERQPVGVSDLSRALDLPKSSVQRALLTLREAGWIQQSKSDQSRWQLTATMLSLSLKSFAEHTLKDIAEPAMQELNSRTGETIHLLTVNAGTLATGACMVEHRVDSNHPVRTFVPIGTLSPLSATAAGHAILAHLPEHEVDRVFGNDLKPYTSHTVTDPADLRRRLGVVRARGFAQNHSEWRSEVAAIAAPIFSASGAVAGAMTISIPASRFDESLVPQYSGWVKELTQGVRPVAGGVS